MTGVSKVKCTVDYDLPSAGTKKQFSCFCQQAVEQLKKTNGHVHNLFICKGVPARCEYFQCLAVHHALERIRETINSVT